MTTINYLVFSGGGAAIYAHGGAISQLALQPEFSFNNIKAVAGASAGSIAALAISLNFTPDEVVKKLTEIDLKKFADGGGMPNKVVRLFTEYGMHTGAELYKYILCLIQEKTNRRDPENVSFADLKALGCKDLYIVTTKFQKENNIPLGKQKIFSYEKTPHTPVAAVVLASCAVPGFFKRVRLLKVEKGKYILSEKGDLFEDGGLMNNYPIDIFDNIKYLSQPNLIDNHQEIINPHTLGLAILPSQLINSYAKPVVKTTMGDNQPFEFSLGVLNALTLKYQKQNLEKRHHRERTIQIDRQNVNFANLKVDEKTIQELIAAGKKAVRDYFSIEKLYLTKPSNNYFFSEKNDLMKNSNLKNTEEQKKSCCTVI